MPDDENRINHVLTRFGEAWNRHDMSAFARLFAADGDFVDVFGNRFKGTAEIESALSARHAGVFNDSRFDKKESTIRFLTPDIALVHAVWELTGARSPEGVPQPSTLGMMTYVMIKESAGWAIAALQNTLVSAPPTPRQKEGASPGT